MMSAQPVPASVVVSSGPALFAQVFTTRGSAELSVQTQPAASAQVVASVATVQSAAESWAVDCSTVHG